MGVLSLLAIGFAPTLATAQSIKAIRVEGVVHSPLERVLQVIETRVGDDLTSPATRWRINDDVRAVFALGVYNDVQADYEVEDTEAVIIFRIDEKPRVNDTRYDGADRFNKRRLDRELEFDSSEVIFYDQLLAERYRQQLMDFYIKQSYPRTTIQTRAEPTADPSLVDLVFTIQEGERLPVKEIVFSGNTVLDDGNLKKNIQTKESWWFLIKREYNESVIQQDLRRLQIAYWDVGYLDVVIEEGPLEEIDGGLRVHFVIDEGEPYVLGGIIIEGNQIYSTEELLTRIASRPGDRFSFRKIQDDVVNMLNLYREQGFLDVQVPPITEVLDKDQANQVVNLWLPISEAPRKFLGMVEIEGVITLDDGTVAPVQEGEFKTREHVIRRELELEEGEPLDWTKVIKSDRNLVNTGFFKTRPFPIPGELNIMAGERPGFERVPTADPEVENLRLQLEEAQTGHLSFGGGISTTFGPSLFATLGERNLFGYGVRGQITGEWGRYRNRVQLNLMEPYLFGSDISLDWDIYYIDRKAVGGRTFDEERIGTSFLFGYYLTDELRLLWGFKVENTDLNPERGSRFDLDPVSIPREFNLGNNMTTSVMAGFSYDTRDFRMDPTSGVYTRSMLEVAGLTDNEFVKFTQLANWYRELWERMVFAASTEFEIGHAYGDPGFLPLQERFFMGGARTVRGFREGSIGDFARIFYKDPTFGSFRSYLGGEAAHAVNLETRYSFTEVFQGVVFMDAGSVWHRIGDIDPTDYRVSAGLGLRVRIPYLNAIIRFDFPFVLRKFSEDETEFFHFSFGQTF